MALEQDPEQALALYDRAAASDPGDADLLRAGAATLIGLGRVEAAEERLETLLLQHPYDREAAELLVGLLLERGVGSDRALELAGRAVRFRGGADALDLKSRVHELRGEANQAAEASARARQLRNGPPPAA